MLAWPVNFEERLQAQKEFNNFALKSCMVLTKDYEALGVLLCKGSF